MNSDDGDLWISHRNIFRPLEKTDVEVRKWKDDGLHEYENAVEDKVGECNGYECVRAGACMSTDVEHYVMFVM